MHGFKLDRTLLGNLKNIEYCIKVLYFLPVILVSYQSNLGFHYTYAVTQVDCLYAMTYRAYTVDAVIHASGGPTKY